MKTKSIATLVVVLLLGFSVKAQILKSKEKMGHLSFFSETPMENIDGKSEAANSIINTLTDSVIVKVAMVTFKFPKALMEEHFNENYVESEKFPFASYRGKINQKVDFTKDGVTKVTSTGRLTLHGVEKMVNMEGTITVKGEEVRLQSDFKIKLADYKVEVPKLLVQNIAEDMKCKCDITYIPYKKK